jgi:hypothetical protein
MSGTFAEIAKKRPKSIGVLPALLMDVSLWRKSLSIELVLLRLP